MAIHPSDLGGDFVRSGKRLITQPSSDVLLRRFEQEEAKQKDRLNYLKMIHAGI